MSITKLPVNYIDGVIDGTRKYEMVENQDHTYSFTDVSQFIRAELLVSADEFNNVNETINDVIDLAEDNDDRLDTLEDDIADIVSGDTQVGRVQSADYATSVTSATSATTADHADSVTSAGYATNVTRATSADSATSVTNVTEADTASTADSAITAGSVDNDFVLSRQTLNFQGRTCTIYDSRITNTSLVEVYYTEETEDTAKQAKISATVDTIRVILTAENAPTGTIIASIKVRVA